MYLDGQGLLVLQVFQKLQFLEDRSVQAILEALPVLLV
jgi:hypothetical protein